MAFPAAILARPKLWGIGALAALVGYLWLSGNLAKAHVKTCKAQWVTAQTEADRILAENIAREYAQEAQILRLRNESLEAELSAVVRQKDAEKAAKWAARNLLNEIRENPDAVSFLDRVWPERPRQWVCQPTGSGPGCDDADQDRSADDTGAAHSAG